MKFLKERKSFLLLIFLILATGFIKLMVGGGTALTLMSFFTFVTAIYVILKYLNRKQENKWLRVIRILFRIGLILMGSLSILILTLVSLPQLSCEEIGNEIQDVEYMIILGAGLKDGDQLSYTLSQRLDKALEVFNQNPNLKIIASGGQGSDEKLSEAQAIKNHLIKNGVLEGQIFLEDQSSSTSENLIFSQKKIEEMELLEQSTKMLQPSSLNYNQPMIIVSSNYHMFRVNFIAKKLDLEPIGICSPAYLSLRATSIIREIPAVVNDFMGNVLK